MTGPRVLLVNDDGVDAPGLRVLEEAARRFTDDLWIVAPDEERSGAGHAISLTQPIRLQQRDERRFAVKGSPTDCVALALHEILRDRKPDFLFSGVNRGPNLAEDATYSGTIGAAMEGLLNGVRSVALSLLTSSAEKIHWETARRYAPIVLEKLLGAPWDPAVLANVNFPDSPPEEVLGLRVTRQGQRPPGLFKPVRRVDERGLPYYWMKGGNARGGETEDNDLGAMRDKVVSITPLRMDMTAERALPEFERLFQKI